MVSRGKHFITYYRRTQLLADPSEEDGRLWLQELRVKRPLVEAERREESAGTTRSISQPTPHLVSYTTINNVKIAILSNSPDQQPYKDPKAAWRRIFRQEDHAKEDSAADSTTALAKAMVSNTSSRKRGRPPGSNKSQCSKPKAIRGVKARRLEPVTIEEQSKPVSHVHGTTNINNNDNHTHTNNNDNTTINTNECNHHDTISNLNASVKYTPHNYNQTNSNTNNTCDSPSNISQTALVYAYSRNNTSNNNINTHNTPRQDNDNQYYTNNNTNINNISQLDPDNSDTPNNKVNKHVHPSHNNNCHYSSNLRYNNYDSHMNTHPNLQNRQDNNSSTLYVQNKEDNNQNQINNNTNNLNNPNNNYDVTITADITMESNWNTTGVNSRYYLCTSCTHAQSKS